jgi:hypothetical protein
MCWWAVSLTVGPNYNLPIMAQPRATVAWEALQQAQRHMAVTSPVEQALIEALAQRYKGPEPLDPSNEGPVLAAYAEAMKSVATRFSDDADVSTMTAEAMMNINAWKLWTLDGGVAKKLLVKISLPVSNALIPGLSIWPQALSVFCWTR